MLAIPVVPNAIDAVQLLREAIAKLDERGTEYDNTGQHRERSAPMIGRLFAGAADRELSDREVWLLLQQVKRARLHTAPGHVDSIVDLIAYTALEGEAMIEARRMADKAKENIKLVSDETGPRYPIHPPDTGEGAREGYELSFGKHKGKTLLQVLDTDPGYIVWLHEKEVLTIHEDFLVRVYHRQAAEDEDTDAALEEVPYAEWRDNVPEY